MKLKKKKKNTKTEEGRTLVCPPIKTHAQGNLQRNKWLNGSSTTSPSSATAETFTMTVKQRRPVEMEKMQREQER